MEKGKIDKDMVKQIKKTEEAVGQMYPVIMDINNQIVDGQHRKEANPEWKSIKRDDIQSTEDRLKYRLVANHARKNNNSDTWTEDLIEFAKHLKNKGYDQGEISIEISRLTGLPVRTIQHHLPGEFKRSGGYNKEPTVEKETQASVPEPTVVSPINIKKMFELAENQLLPNVQIKKYPNTAWSALLVDKKILENIAELCEKRGVKVEDMIGALLIRIVKDLEEEA